MRVIIQWHDPDLQFLRLERSVERRDNGCLNTRVETVLDAFRSSQAGPIRVNEADRQILFGLVAIRLKLVTLAAGLAARSRTGRPSGERSLARLLIERRQLDEASGALVESAVEHHVRWPGAMRRRASSRFTGSDDLEALRHVLERTIKPVPPAEKTVARGEQPPVSAPPAGNGTVEAARRDPRQSRCRTTARRGR